MYACMYASSARHATQLPWPGLGWACRGCCVGIPSPRRRVSLLLSRIEAALQASLTSRSWTCMHAYVVKYSYTIRAEHVGAIGRLQHRQRPKRRYASHAPGRPLLSRPPVSLNQDHTRWMVFLVQLRGGGDEETRRRDETRPDITEQREPQPRPWAARAPWPCLPCPAYIQDSETRPVQSSSPSSYVRIVSQPFFSPSPSIPQHHPPCRPRRGKPPAQLDNPPSPNLTERGPLTLHSTSCASPRMSNSIVQNSYPLFLLLSTCHLTLW
ncbi:hypothetical protein LY76DRAFT_195337 [Colletotrichum caudatum]|nr:hypothetical protein LY76DRAFT_195337 [Colletotrichum caudatum]